MKLEEAFIKLTAIANQPLVNFVPEGDLKQISVNKGAVGQLIETILGLPHTSLNVDFEDGELKTNKCDFYGNPLETIAIKQIGDEEFNKLISHQPFEQSLLYQKIKNMLYVPVYRDGDVENWRILPCVHIDIRKKEYGLLRNTLQRDYEYICDELRNRMEQEDMIHTTSGKYLQIRSKDYKDKKTQQYHPIYSAEYQRYVSNKKYAFYFKKDFIKEVVIARIYDKYL